MAVVLSLLVLSPVPAAVAVGDGVLNVTLTPIDISDNSTITDIESGAHNNRITYRVQYSCATATCEDTELQFTPSQPDPYGILPSDRFLLMWESWVAPAGASISGTNATGMLVNLGDLAAGVSGSFTMTYLVSPDRHRDVPWSSFYPDGFQIEMAATASSETAVGPVTANSAAVTWNIDVPSGPAVGITAPASVNADTPVSYALTMTGGNLYYGPGANITGDASLSAVGNYTVVYQAPPEAVIISAEHGGVIDSIANTVTWTSGSLADPIYGARGGWGFNAVSGFNGQGAAPDNVVGDENFALWRFRSVELEYPGENFPAADANGCNFAQSVTSSMEVSVTYLDSARTTRTASTTRSSQVACWDPFGGLATTKDVPGGAANQFATGDGNMGGGIFSANVPAPGAVDRTALLWRVGVSNQGNVAAVAVIDEPDLSQPDMPVYQIFPTGVGASIEWERSDGATGITILASGQALTAPAGTWFTSSRATTDPIPAGRVQQSDTTSTTIYLNFRTRISSTAPIGETRTNAASISLTYPGYEDEIDDQPLESVVERSIRFTQPSPIMGASFVGTPVIDGGGPLFPTVPVTYQMRGSTNQIWPGTDIVPQLAFVAPVGWQIIPGSANIDGGPAGVTYDYATKMIDGVPREVVVATWPSSTTPSTTGWEDWPILTVQATPTASAPTSTGAAVAQVWAGDDSGVFTTTTSNAYITSSNQFRPQASGVVDTADIDGDGNLTEAFARTNNPTALTVSSPSAIQTLKELCIPDADEGLSSFLCFQGRLPLVS